MLLNPIRLRQQNILRRNKSWSASWNK